MTLKYLGILAIAFVLSGCMPGGDNRVVPLRTTAMIGQAATILTAYRADAGVPAPMVQNAALQAAAQAHADDLAGTSGISHLGRDGSRPSDRVARAGYSACFVAENVARGQPDTSTVFSDWAASREHYENMVNAAANQFGFARAGDVWVLVLARRC